MKTLSHVRMSAGLSSLFVLFGLAVGAQGPAPTDSSAQFEVTSVRRNKSGALGESAASIGVLPGGRFQMINGPVRALILSAYPSLTSEVIGPSWVLDDRFDVIAKAAGPLTVEESRPMLRALLADRFRLVAHFEARVRPTYALVVDRPDGRLGPGLRRLDVDCKSLNSTVGSGTTPAPVSRPNGAKPCSYSVGGGRLLSGGVPLLTLARSITGAVGRVVLDRTGLQGDYEFTLEYSTKLDDGKPSVFTAVREQLGLKLEAQDNPLDVVVVDRIEQPTED